jgi:glycosyltransferase AglI
MENTNLCTRIDLPFASIIIPVYNSQNIIGECLESLLTQNYPKNKYEIIVVDNRSTDHTAEIIKRYPVKYLFEGTIQSSYAARNRGVKHSVGEALVFFDADQVATVNYLKNLLGRWDQKNFGAFIGREINIVTGSPFLEKYFESDDTESIQNDLVILSTSCTACRKTSFETLGGFDSSLVSGGDRDFGIRLQKELGLEIKHIHDAVFYHKQPRSNVPSVLKREIRMAFGSTMLGLKHPEFKKSLFSCTVQASMRTILGLGALLRGVLKSSDTKNRREHVLTILLDVASRWAYCYGVLLYYLGAQRCGDLPPGTKGGRL